ncbi:hypothetical protein L3i20_v218870 [Paenibacillus sp. L3-i20]|nr:hypothetical protein L3i20_v218870 [Paenibacillus sp. L3-i20]
MQALRLQQIRPQLPVIPMLSQALLSKQKELQSPVVGMIGMSLAYYVFPISCLFSEGNHQAA